MEKLRHQDQGQDLTSERLSRGAENSFSLVNLAIRMSEELVLSGKIPSRVDSATNIAAIVLESIREGKTNIEDIISSWQRDFEDEFDEDEELMIEEDEEDEEEGEIDDESEESMVEKETMS